MEKIELPVQIWGKPWEERILRKWKVINIYFRLPERAARYLWVLEEMTHRPRAGEH